VVGKMYPKKRIDEQVHIPKNGQRISEDPGKWTAHK